MWPEKRWYIFTCVVPYESIEKERNIIDSNDTNENDRIKCVFSDRSKIWVKTEVSSYFMYLNQC